MNHKQIQKAIDAASKFGGGYITVPPGVYLTGSVSLATNVYMVLEPGAVLQGSADPKYVHGFPLYFFLLLLCLYWFAYFDCAFVAFVAFPFPSVLLEFKGTTTMTGIIGTLYKVAQLYDCLLLCVCAETRLI